MAEYLCVIRDRLGCWVTATGYDCQDEARNYGDYFGDVVGLVAKRTGIRPPVGMRSKDASHALRYGMKFNVIGVEKRK